MSEEQTKDQAKKKRRVGRPSARPKRPKKNGEVQGASAAARKPLLKKREKKSSAAPGAAAEREGAARGIRQVLVRFLRVPVLVCVAIVVALVLLYGPARNLYCAWRENGELKAQDAQALSEKDQIQEDISDLTSKDGIKDQAREMGYVDEGETRIIVEGDDDKDEDPGADAPAETDDPAYLQMLDLIFGYEGEGQ